VKNRQLTQASLLKNVDSPVEKNVVDNGTFMYAKHGKLVDADTSAPKVVQNTSNHV